LGGLDDSFDRLFGLRIVEGWNSLHIRPAYL
jgi:hypothetical protein